MPSKIVVLKPQNWSRLETQLTGLPSEPRLTHAPPRPEKSTSAPQKHNFLTLMLHGVRSPGGATVHTEMLDSPGKSLYTIGNPKRRKKHYGVLEPFSVKKFCPDMVVVCFFLPSSLGSGLLVSVFPSHVVAA